VLPDLQVILVTLDIQDQQAELAIPVIQDIPVPPESPVLQVVLVIPDILVPPELPVLLVILVFRDIQVFPVLLLFRLLMKVDLLSTCQSPMET
jgi:hypothetical protein